MIPFFVLLKPYLRFTRSAAVARCNRKALDLVAVRFAFVCVLVGWRCRPVRLSRAVRMMVNVIFLVSLCTASHDSACSGRKAIADIWIDASDCITAAAPCGSTNCSTLLLGRLKLQAQHPDQVGCRHGKTVSASERGGTRGDPGRASERIELTEDRPCAGSKRVDDLARDRPQRGQAQARRAGSLRSEDRRHGLWVASSAQCALQETG